MSKPTYEELEKRVKELEKSDSKYKQSDERLLNSFIDQNPFPTWISDEKGTMIRANSALKKVLNLTDEQLIGKYNVLKDPQVEEQGLIQVIRDTLEKGKTSDFVLVWDGYNVTDVKLEGSKKVDVEGTIFPIFDNDGNVTNAVITYKEVSERKKAEELLLESEEKYRSLVNDIPDVIWTGDIDGKSYFLSNNVESMLGYTTQEIYEGGEDFVFDRIHPEDVGRIRTCYQNLFRKETSFDEEYRFQRKDGEWVWLRDKATEIYEKDGVKYVNGIFSDITERKKAEDALHSEKLFSEEYINSMPGLFYVFDKKRFVRWNKNWTAVTGYSDEELAAMNGKDFFEGEDRKLIGERMLKVFKEGVADAEAELVTKDGRRIFYYFTGQRKVLGGNEYLIGLGIDITEKMKAEKALRESQKKLLDAQYISKMGGFTWNIQTGEASWSEGMYRLLKYDIDETIDYAKVNKNIHHPEDLERVTEWLSDSIASGKKELVPNEYRIICKDGEIIDVQTNGRIEYEGGKAIKLFGTSLNITERRKADAQQKAIHEISQSVVTTENMDEFYSEVHKSLDSVIDTTNIFIALHEEDSEHITFPYWVDERDGAPLQMSLKDSMSGTAEVILSGKSMFNTEKDYREMIEEGKIELHGSASKVWLGVPLKTKKRTIGALVVQSYKDTKLFSEEDVQFLEVIADSIANAIQHMKSEEALKESEEKYQDLYDNAPDMFCSVDAETAKITQCNTTLCDRTGYSREEIIGRPIFEMYHPESLDGAEKAFKSFGETGVVNNAELQLKRKDGSKIDVMLNVTSTKDEKGNVLMSRSVWR
ncbi:MAG: PAS domain S-box protein, partial [bacterium]|nr:PAS domain S-box protein [bacterium]